ncbi:MAG: hypothetical protein M1818_006679 [Claussenomyces sp. TS43310]|nr:MAG: hypothetical protein M1818_006679 [Claussenomyces sp. TS43310]
MRGITAQNGRTAVNASFNTPVSRSAQPIKRYTTPTIPKAVNASIAHVEKDLREVMTKRDKLLHGSTIPTEAEIMTALTACEVIGEQLINPSDQSTTNADGSAASALLSVDESTEVRPAPTSQESFPAVQKAVDQLSDIAYSIMTHPHVFITAQILKKYVDLQTLLRKPTTFPEIFRLYSSKPIPEEGSSPIRYKKQNPDKVASAIPAIVADKALQSAIDVKILGAAMGIVESAHAKHAFRRAKFVRKGLLPLTAFAVAPVAAYSVASQLSLYQTTMDPATATNVAFAGILTYLGCTTTIGLVAVTTANDQMDRITWATGMPLRERWIREEERAAVDKVAGAWGFRQSLRRGEEEGADWEAIREWAGRKGMILDRVDLMEGME